MRKTFFWLCAAAMVCGCSSTSKPTSAKQSLETTSYTNPVIWADAPDLSVVRKGEDYYLISTTMHLMPGAPGRWSNILLMQIDRTILDID